MIDMVTTRSQGKLFPPRFGLTEYTALANVVFIGMFLFARLVLKHLKDQVSLNQLKKELEPSRFPTQLYEM